MFPEPSFWTELVTSIHARPVRIVAAVTGGGSRAISELLRVSGGARTMLEALVPYSGAAVDDFLGGKPEHYVCDRTARALAAAAFVRADKLASATAGPAEATKAGPLLGLGCTASLASDRPKRGPHRVQFAVQTADFTSSYGLQLSKGARTRAEEEDLTAGWLLAFLAEATGVVQVEWPSLMAGEHSRRVVTTALPAWRDVWLGASRCARQSLQGETTAIAAPPPGLVLFPGAFNPLHAGHKQMAALAETILGRPVGFELSLTNVDKPPLDYTEIAERTGQFSRLADLWLTRASTFVEKARIFPAATFVVGADTLLRIDQARYYGGSHSSAAAAIAEIRAAGGRFLVFGRQTASRFETLRDLAISDALRECCQEVTADQFRCDVSSTHLRRAVGGDAADD